MTDRGARGSSPSAWSSTSSRGCFGSQALYPVATGLVARRRARGRLGAALAPPPGGAAATAAARDVVEGEDVRIDLVVQRGDARCRRRRSSRASGSAGSASAASSSCRSAARRYAGGYELRAVPRGRYPFETVSLSVEDPFGLAHVALDVEEPQALVVYPAPRRARPALLRGRLAPQRRAPPAPAPAVRASSCTASATTSRASRCAASTGRRPRGAGHLMVKELEDAPRDEVAVLLDGDAAAVAGRAAGVELRRRRAGGRLDPAGAGAARAALRPDRQLGAARDAGGRVGRSGLAPRARAARRLRADRARRPRSRCSTRPAGAGGALARARRRHLARRRRRSCTGSCSARSRAAASRSSTSSRRASPARRGRPEPLLLRLQAAGIPVAVVRRGDDLAAALRRPHAAWRPSMARALRTLARARVVPTVVLAATAGCAPSSRGRRSGGPPRSSRSRSPSRSSGRSRPGSRRARRRARARGAARVRPLAARRAPVRSAPRVLRPARLPLLERVPRLLRRPPALRPAPPPGHGGRRARRRSSPSRSLVAVAVDRAASDARRAARSSSAPAGPRRCSARRTRSLAGTAILLASLVVLAGLTTRRVPRAVVPAAAALALVAVAASSSPAIAKRGAVSWQTLGSLQPPRPGGERLLRLELPVLRPALAEEEDDRARGAGAADVLALLARGRPRRLLQPAAGRGARRAARTRSSRRRRACARTRRSRS